MGLFDRFRDTVILDSPCALRKKAEALRKIKDQGFGGADLEKELLITELGLAGENQVEFELKNAGIGMYVVHDVTLRYEDLKAQIDFVVVTAHCKFFIECKNLVGNVSVDSNGVFTREYQFKNRRVKEAIYSPYTQAKRHVEIFRKKWDAHQGRILRFLADKWFTDLNVPLVVFANPKGILDLRQAPRDVAEHTVRADQLTDYIKKYCDRMKRDSSPLKEREMRDIAQNFLDVSEPDAPDYSKYFETSDRPSESTPPVTREVPTEAPVSVPKSKPDPNADRLLRDRLIRLRKERSAAMGKPAYFVFNNEELELLIKEKPRTLAELKQKHILKDVRFNTHGKAVVDAISEVLK